MIIKVCGLREADNIREVAALGVDWIGMIFWPKSPRYVSMLPIRAGILPDESPHTQLTSPLAPKKVGVFVDPTAQDVITRVVSCGLDIVQLHGHESPTFIRNLRRTLGDGVKMMKAISVAGTDDVTTYKSYADSVDYFLFDAKCKTMGGSGEQFDWNVLQAYDGDVPFLLSGGIGLDDAKRVEAFCHEQCIGIDLNSRFETAPGVKDVAMLSQFINNLKQSSK